MRYAVARFKHEQERKAYRIYVSDALQIIGENLASSEKKYLTKRYIDVIEPAREETRTCEEITSEIAERCGLTIKNTAAEGGEEL